jgi:hypothetical protein
MADNYVDPSLAGSMALDDPSRSYAPNTYTGGLTQQQLLDLWNKAGVENQFMNQGSLSQDQVAQYGDQASAHQALGNSR